MSVPAYPLKRGDTLSLGGTVAGLSAGLVGARCQLRNPLSNKLVAELVVTLGAYVDASTPRALLLEAAASVTAGWPLVELRGDIEFDEPGGIVVSSQTFVIKVLPDETLPL